MACTGFAVEHVIPQVHDDLFWAQRHPGCVGGAGFLTSATFGARNQIELVFPAELINVRNARRIIWRRGQGTLGPQISEKYVGKGREHMPVL